MRWEGDVLASHSLAHVNRELVRRVLDDARLRVDVVTPEPLDDVEGLLGDPVRARLAGRARNVPGRHAAVVVRHSWPPRLERPDRGAWVHVQPWEFGGLPASWIDAMADHVDEVWCYTNHVRDAYLRAGLSEDQVQLVPLGVDPERFSPAGLRLELEPAVAGAGTRFLFVGGTIHRKGIDVLLRAWVKAFTADDDVVLVVKGSLSDGAYRGSSIHGTLERLRADHPRLAPIEYLDVELADDDVPALYRACDALVLPYRGEGFGLPVAEAMACGLPVVVTGDGATRDFCTEDRAFLLPSTVHHLDAAEAASLPPAGPEGYWVLEPDEDALVDTLRHIHADRAEAAARAQRGREHVVAELGWDRPASLAAERLLALAARGAHAAPTGVARHARREGGASAGPDAASAGPLLSACMIVKDEEAMLPGCLESIAGVVDEIVVYDTGSSDGTVALAEAAGARVVRGYWDDDFGRARNAALAQCSGAWVLHIDADERLAGDPAALRAELAAAGTPPLRLVTIDNMRDDGSVGVRHAAVRVFRRADAHWSGRLHEQVVARSGRSDLVRSRTETVTITHLGYTTDLMADRDKAERNVRLAEADLAEHGDDNRAWNLLNLARSLTVAGRLEDAVARCAEARRVPGTNLHVALANLHHGVEVLFSLGRPGDALPWIAEIRRLDPRGSRRIADFLEGTARLLLGEPAPGLLDLEDGEEVWNDTVGQSVSADLVRHRRALALAAAQRWDEAVGPLGALAADHPTLPVWGPLARATVATGGDPATVTALVPEAHLRAVLAQLLLVAPDAAEPVADLLWKRWPGDPRLVAFATHHGVRCDSARCLEWSARVRGAGLADRCPLVARARHREVDALERVRAACIAHTAFGDERAAQVLAELGTELEDATLALATIEVDTLAPALLALFVHSVGEERLTAALPTVSP